MCIQKGENDMKGVGLPAVLAIVMLVTAGGGSVQAATWKADVGIECDGILSPADGAVIAPSAEVTCRVADPKDLDLKITSDSKTSQEPDTFNKPEAFVWKNGGVVTDLAEFEYYNGEEYGHYDPASDTLHVGRLAPTSAGGPWTVWNRNTGQQEVIGAAGEGIDCCAITCIHELNHQWASKVDTGWDSDNDGLSDTFELATAGGWNLDPNYPDTYDIATTLLVWVSVPGLLAIRNSSLERPNRIRVT